MFPNQAGQSIPMPTSGLAQCGTASPPQTVGQKLAILQDGTGDLLAIAGRIHALHFGATPTDPQNASVPQSVHDMLSLLNARVNQACNYLREIEKEYSL